jgi:peptide/nickel transport system permease protein
MPPTLFGLVLLVFAISHIVPYDPARVVAGENAPPEQVEALRRQYGLDLPLPWQFARYVRDVATGNMGTSLFTQRPVAEDLWARLPATFELAICAITLAVVVGVPLGVVAALSRNSVLDHVVRVVTIGGLAMAAFWLAILLQLLFSMWLATPGRDGSTAGDAIRSPAPHARRTAAAIGDAGRRDAHLRTGGDAGAAGDGDVVRFTRAGVLNVMSQRVLSGGDGHPAAAWVEHPAQRADRHTDADRPDLRRTDRQCRGGGALFDWPGLEPAVHSILQSDYNAIMGFTLFVGTVFIPVNRRSMSRRRCWTRAMTLVAD